MKLIINNSSMVPIYEQLVDQIKLLIRSGELRENDILPSVRALSKELKISALTVKKSYDTLESEGFTVTVHGKGTYVKAVNTDLLLEEQKKEVTAYQTQQLKQAILHAQNSQCDLLILDEIIASYNLGLIDKDMLKEFILNKPEALELVLTGRDPADYMIEAADYVTEMKKIKHPFDAGIPARLGVEW